MEEQGFLKQNIPLEMLLLRPLRTQQTMMAMIMTARAATTGTIRLGFAKNIISCSSSSTFPDDLESPGSSLAGARVPVTKVLMALLDKYFSKCWLQMCQPHRDTDWIFQCHSNFKTVKAICSIIALSILC